MLGFGAEQGYSAVPRTLEVEKLAFPLFSRHTFSCSAVYGIAFHPTIDLIVTCGRDSTVRVSFYLPSFLSRLAWLRAYALWSCLCAYAVGRATIVRNLGMVQVDCSCEMRRPYNHSIIHQCLPESKVS